MGNQTSDSIFQLIVNAWKNGKSWVKVAVFLGFGLIVVAGVLLLLAQNKVVVPDVVARLFSTLLLTGGGLLVAAGCYHSMDEGTKRDEIIDAAEKCVKDNPGETQAAWKIARVTLESYINRNLRQVSAIFWLTVMIMILGFALIGYGVSRVYVGKDFEPSIVVAVSGVLVNFIGGSFLLVYRSVMSQASTYVSVLERINAVGMSMQILESLKNADADLIETTKADLVRLTLQMYSAHASSDNK